MQGSKVAGIKLIKLMGVIVSLSAGGCAVTPRPEYKLPDYAARTGPQTWAVICNGRQVFGDWNNYSAFFDDAGNAKDQKRFCDDVQTGTRIFKR